MTTTIQVGAGTKLLAEWAMKEFWPCKSCYGQKRQLHVSLFARLHRIDCPCTQDPWLAAIIADPYDAGLYLVYADWLGDRGDPREADVRMVARLLPLDVFPEENDNGGLQDHTWWNYRSLNDQTWPSHSVPSVEMQPDKDRGWIGYPTILSALHALDSALTDHALQEKR